MNDANTHVDAICPAGESIDQAHERLGHTAPRVTPAEIEANIACEYFQTGDQITAGCPQHESLKLLTVCILVMRNGFVVIGHSAPASPENFNAELGRRFARENAVREMWPLMGYALREDLHRASELASKHGLELAGGQVDGGAS